MEVPDGLRTLRIFMTVILAVVLLKLRPSSHGSVGNQFVQHKYFRHHKC